MNKKIKDIQIPTILVVFGITGDLGSKKIIPSLWRLYNQGLILGHFQVLGFSRSELTTKQLSERISTIVLSLDKKATKEKIESFVEKFSYQSGTFESIEGFKSLANKIQLIGQSWGVCANKLFYLAVPPKTYQNIFKNLATVKLNIPCGGKLGWSRILIEKPFGVDLKSAQELQDLLQKYFKEEQIYRIDHYLFKEIVQGIENFRFSNNLFEDNWNNEGIDRIDIKLHESIGIESRGAFYDGVGALRDVGQNHLLTILSVLLMEQSLTRDSKSIRTNRSTVINKLIPWSKALLKENTFRAQYANYQNMPGVDKDSKTETFFAIKTSLNNDRWKDVPIYIEAGKSLKEARKEIIVTLKHPKNCVLCKVGSHKPNQIIFRLEPNDEIQIHFWTKKPGYEQILEERTLSFFLYEKKYKAQYVEEYAKVLRSAIMGQQEFFVSTEEVKLAWKFTDPIISAWQKNQVPLQMYKPNTTPQPVFLKPEADIDDKRIENKGTLGIIGLGKMGSNLAKQLLTKNWSVVGYNRSPDIARRMSENGLVPAYSIKDLVVSLPSKKVVWLMVPAGKPVDEVIFGHDGLVNYLTKGDVIIDGGNSYFKDSIRRYKKLEKLGINFLDAGVSGGPDGALNGASIMIGGKRKVYKDHESLFADLAVKNGYQFFEGSGMGHFVKMIHNGIEYGMMQSIAEGFAVMKKYDPKLDLQTVADIYNHGSVVESRLMGWLKNAFRIYGNNLSKISGRVDHTGEGEWTIQTAKQVKIKTEVIKESLEFRIKSKNNPSYTGKILSALRGQFGKHDVK